MTFTGRVLYSTGLCIFCSQHSLVTLISYHLVITLLLSIEPKVSSVISDSDCLRYLRSNSSFSGQNYQGEEDKTQATVGQMISRVHHARNGRTVQGISWKTNLHNGSIVSCFQMDLAVAVYNTHEGVLGCSENKKK